jgi:hypothetical protein
MRWTLIVTIAAALLVQRAALAAEGEAVAIPAADTSSGAVAAPLVEVAVPADTSPVSQATDASPAESVASETPATVDEIARPAASGDTANTDASKQAEVFSGERLPPQTGRPYYVRGSAAFRMLAISDEDPSNDRAMFYGAELGYRPFAGLTLYLRSGISQRFTTPSSSLELVEEHHQGFVTDGERDSLITSPFLIRDSALGGVYRHSIDLADYPVTMAHALNLIFPTSIASQDRGLYFAPDLSSRSRVKVFDRLGVGLDLGVQYRFHKFAEQLGPAGTLNTQWALQTGLGLDFNVFESAEWGSLDLGAGIGWIWLDTYDSIDGEDYWRQTYSWDVGASWAPRAWLVVAVGLEQGAPVSRSNQDPVYLFSRDQLEMSFSISATY